MGTTSRASYLFKLQQRSSHFAEPNPMELGPKHTFWVCNKKTQKICVLRPTNKGGLIFFYPPPQMWVSGGRCLGWGRGNQNLIGPMFLWTN